MDEEMFKYRVTLAAGAEDAFAGLDAEHEILNLETNEYAVYSRLPLDFEFNFECPQIVEWDDLFEYCNDRFGVLEVYTPESLYVIDEETGQEIDLTEAGEWLDNLLKEHSELGLSVEDLKWEHDHYFVWFERDLDFIADGQASFGWGSNFVPAVSIPAMNEAARKSDFQFSFKWQRRP